MRTKLRFAQETLCYIVFVSFSFLWSNFHASQIYRVWITDLNKGHAVVGVSCIWLVSMDDRTFKLMQLRWYYHSHIRERIKGNDWKQRVLKIQGAVTIRKRASEIYGMTPFAFPRVCQSLCTRCLLMFMYTTHFSEKLKEMKYEAISKEKETWVENSLSYTPYLRPSPPSWSQRRRHRQSCPSLPYLSNLSYLSSSSCSSCLLSSPSAWCSAGPPSLHIGIWLWVTQ